MYLSRLLSSFIELDFKENISDDFAKSHSLFTKKHANSAYLAWTLMPCTSAVFILFDQNTNLDSAQIVAKSNDKSAS